MTKQDLKTKILELTKGYIEKHICRSNIEQHYLKEEIKFLQSILDSLNGAAKNTKAELENKQLTCELCEEPLEKVMGKVCKNTMCERYR